MDTPTLMYFRISGPLKTKNKRGPGDEATPSYGPDE